MQLQVAGHKVRFDITTAAASRFCTEDLADYVELEPVCPEMKRWIANRRAQLFAVSTRMLDDIISTFPAQTGQVT